MEFDSSDEEQSSVGIASLSTANQTTKKE